MSSKATPYPKKELYSDKNLPTLRGRNLLQVALPMGGIGAGCICLNGQGGLQDFSIRNAPAISAVADGHFPQDSAFATLYIPSRGIARLVEGPMPTERITTRASKARGIAPAGSKACRVSAVAPSRVNIPSDTST